MKRLLFALLAILTALPLVANAAMTVVDSPSLGLPGPADTTEIQMQDLRVTYRFDQMNEPGKSVGMIPVQMTAKLHNYGSTKSLDVAIPLVSAHNIKPEIASFFANGQEQMVQRSKTVSLAGKEIEAATVRLNLVKDAEVIIDIRLLQPIDGNILPLLISTASGWKDMIPSGTIEAITPFKPMNWNVEMRRVEGDALVPVTYADNSAAYSFQNLTPSEAQDVYWHFADMEALEYFARGNERFQKTQGDAKSYEMMRSGLLDMIPCNGVRMPLASWWSNMYETITLGVIASVPEGQERIAKAMELWSNNYTVMTASNRECEELKQRPDKYKTALNQLLAIQPAERSTYANDALKSHDKFMKEMSEKLGDGSIAKSEAAVLADDDSLSETDKQILGDWDARFDDENPAQGAQAGGAEDVEDDNGSFVSSTLSAFDNWMPNLSLGSQIMLFVFLLIILIIIVSFIVMRWKEGDQPKPPTVYQSSPSATKKPSAPSFINKDTPVPTKKPDFKPPIAMRDVPAYPPAPEQPRKPESFGQVNNEKKVLEEKKSTDFKQQNKDAKQREKPNSTGFKFEKPATPKGPILEQKIQDKIPENKSSDPPWIKKEAKQELIKPSAPPPKPSDNNFPWQKKSEQKNNNEQPPGPTVNI